MDGQKTTSFIISRVVCSLIISFRSSLRQVVLINSCQAWSLGTRNMGSAFSKKYALNNEAPSCQNQCGKRGIITQVEENVVEVEVCHKDDIGENEMKVFDVIEDGKILLVKQNGEFHALGHKCTHYGAPLVNGALGDGRIRCQWHGACFNLKTGDIEDFPGFDSLPCHQVSITETGNVKVRAKISLLKSGKAIKDIGQMSPCNNDTVVIIGGGPSGATCAETLRHEGFTGRVVIVAKENHLPYDRIKVSKIGVVPAIEKLQVRSQEYYENSQIEILKGVEATAIDPKHKYVTLSDGNRIPYSSVYIATGSKPRIPDIPGVDARNVFTVRNYEDSTNIQDALGNSRLCDLVVLGLSFIGLEIAASCFDKAKSVTVVGTDKAPLNHVFGAEIGAALRKLYEEKGVKFHFETTITKCVSSNGAISSVHLSNGKVLSADVLVLGVGTTFNTEFLKSAKINMESNGAVTVNEKLETNVANVYAGGDIAHAPVFAAGNKQMTIGHIGLAQYHGRVAALNILKLNSPVKTVPYFFSMLFGKSIRYAGYGRPASTLIDGEVDGLKFLMYFFDENEKVIALASCMRDPIVSQFAEFMHQGKELYKKDLKENPLGWTKSING